MNALAQITITRSGTGWLVTCLTCGDFERHTGRRPAADLLAHDHRKTCRPKPEKQAAAPKPRPRASWANREESTWIDKL